MTEGGGLEVRSLLEVVSLEMRTTEASGEITGCEISWKVTSWWVAHGM